MMRGAACDGGPRCQGLGSKAMGVQIRELTQHGWSAWGKGSNSIAIAKSGFGKGTIQLGERRGPCLGGASIGVSWISSGG